MELYTEKSKLWYFPPDFSKDIPRYAISRNILKLDTESSKNDNDKKEDIKPEADRSAKSLDTFELYEEILPLKISDNLQVVKSNDREDLIFNNRNLGVIISEYTDFINCWNDGIELLKGNPHIIKKIDDSKNQSPINKKLQLSKYLYNNLNNYLLEKQISIKIITWNIAGLSGIYKSEDITELFSEEKDMYVLNLQETIPLTLNTFYSSPLIVQEWISYILESLSKLHSSDYEYLSDNRLLGLTTVVIVKKWLKPQISNVELFTTGTGILNVFGNKGAILISFNLSFDKDILAHIEELKKTEKQKLFSKISTDNSQVENVDKAMDSTVENVDSKQNTTEEINQHGYKIVIVNCHLSAGDQNINKRKKQLQSIENNLNLKKFYKNNEFAIFSQKLASPLISKNAGQGRRGENNNNSFSQDIALISTETLTSGKLENGFEFSNNNLNNETENDKLESFTDLDDIEINEIQSSKLTIPSIGSTSSVDLSNNQEPESNQDTSFSLKRGIIPKINTSVSSSYSTTNKKSLGSPTDSVESKKCYENQSIASKLASPILSKFYNNTSSSSLSVTNNNSNNNLPFQREGIASRLASPILNKFYNYSPTSASPFANGNDSGLERDNMGSATDNFDDCFMFIGGDLNFRLSNFVTKEFIDKPIKKMNSKTKDTDSSSDIASTTTEIIVKDSSPLSSLSMDNTFDDSGLLDNEDAEDDFKQEVRALMDAGNYASLTKFDTLTNEIQKNNLFNGFKEPEISFLPTYKIFVSEKTSDKNNQSLIKNQDIEFSIEDDSTTDVRRSSRNESSKVVADNKEIEHENKELGVRFDKELMDKSETSDTKLEERKDDIQSEKTIEKIENKCDKEEISQKENEKKRQNSEDSEESKVKFAAAAQENKQTDSGKAMEEKFEEQDAKQNRNVEKEDGKCEEQGASQNENSDTTEKGSEKQDAGHDEAVEEIEKKGNKNEKFISQADSLTVDNEFLNMKVSSESLPKGEENEVLSNANNGKNSNQNETEQDVLVEDENTNILNNSNSLFLSTLPSSKYNFDRIPSYCDRIFYNEKNIFSEQDKAHVYINNYGSPDIFSLTDHKPVFMDLNLKNIKLIDFEKRYQLMKLFLKKLDSEENSQKSSAHVTPTEFSKQDLELLSKERVYEFQIFNDGNKSLKWEIVNYDTKTTNYYKSYNAENIEVNFNYFNEPLIQVYPCKGMIPAKGVQRVKVKLNSINFGITKIVASLILRIIGSNDFFLTYDFHFKESSVFGQSLDLLNNVKEFGSSSGIPPSIYELVNFLSNNLRHDMFDFVYDESKPDALKEKMLSPVDSILRSRLEHKLPLDKEFIDNHTDPDGDNEVLVSVVARTLAFMLNSIDGGIIPKEFSTFILTQEDEKLTKKKGFFNSLLKQKTDKSRSTDIVTKILEFLPGLRANVFMYIISFLTLYTNQYGDRQIDSLVALFEEALFKLPANAGKYLRSKRKEVLKILI